MNKGQENRSTMHSSVDTLLIANKSKTDEIPALGGQIAAFENDVAGLKEELILNKNATSGTSETKWSAEDDLVAALLAIARPMRTIAKQKNNPALAAIVNVNDSGLRHSRDTELVLTAKAIYAEAMKLSPEDMATYNITPDEIAGLAAKIEAYNKSIGGRESSVEVRKGTRQSVVGMYRKVESDLEDIDNSMERLKDKYPEFYNEYNTARVIKATGTRHKSKNPLAGKPPTPPDQTKK
jgi:hypothetical protein